MVPWLVITSVGFVVPAVVGFVRGRKKDGASMAVLTALSVWNHGTHGHLALIVDRAYAHVFAVVYGLRAVRNVIRPMRRAVDSCIMAMYTCIMCLYAREIHSIRLLEHLGIHICTITAFTTHMLTCDQST